MSSPCQASWMNNDDEDDINECYKNLHYFFRRYDELTAQAQTLALDRTALADAQATFDAYQTRLQNTHVAMEKNDANIKEQTNRIALVSSHWFYGNTIYQPQLWLRGGCTGKMERARRKLETAQQNRTILLQAQSTTQQDYNDAQERLTQCQASLNRSSLAEIERNQRYDALVLERHPSAHLLDLLHERARHQTTIETLNGRTEELNDIGRTFDQVQHKLKSALILAQQAEAAVHRRERLEQESTSFSSRTAPSVVHHQQHHHDRCNNSRRRPGSIHSQEGRGQAAVVPVQRSHCQSYHSSTGTRSSTTTTMIIDDRDMERRNRNLLQMEREQCTATDALQKTQNIMKEGSSMLEAAVDKLIRYIRSHGVVKIDPPSRFVVLGGGLLNLTVASRLAIEEFQLQITQLQSLREENDAIVQQFKKDVSLDRDVVQEALQRTQVQISTEKTRIFDSLREQAMMELSCIPIVPSAPNNNDPDSLYDSRAARGSNKNYIVGEIPILLPTERMSVAGGGPIVVAETTPVLIPTERLSDIPFATTVHAVVPTAPPEILDNHCSTRALDESSNAGMRSQRIVVTSDRVQ